LLRSSFELGDDEIITSFLHIPQSAKPTLGFSDQHACVVPLILEPVDQTNFPDIIPEEDDDEEPEQWQAAEEVVAAMEDAEADKIFEAEFGIKYKGVTVETFEFLDLSEALRGMVSDSRYTHGFKVRGLTYMDDKKKVSFIDRYFPNLYEVMMYLSIRLKRAQLWQSLYPWICLL
jgi:hypothetical protein